MQKHLHDPPPRPAQVAPDLPEGLEPIILRCLEKLPERRYPNMKELLRDLAKLQEREP
jgi:serine/threonine-protein kinase